MDHSVRRCGMLVAEVVAQRCGKKLQFGDWEGDEGNKSWAKQLRAFIQAKDVDANIAHIEDQNDSDDEETKVASVPSASKAEMEVVSEPANPMKRAAFADKGYDSDDSMTGYASPPSSRSSSPSPSELADIEKDPTLNVGRKKVPRPVYLAQLGDLLRGTGTKASGSTEPHEADRIEMALNCAEELIRKKRNYGTELGVSSFSSGMNTT